MRERDERAARIEDNDAGEMPTRGGQLAVPHLPLNGTKVPALRLEENTRSVRLVPEHCRLAVWQPFDGFEQAVHGH